MGVYFFYSQQNRVNDSLTFAEDPSYATISGAFYSPIIIDTSKINSYGFFYELPTRLYSVTTAGPNVYQIVTGLTDLNVPVLITENETRVMALDDGKERELPKSVLANNMDVVLSLFYNLHNTRWTIKKIVITSQPYAALQRERFATSSAQPDL